MSYINDHEEIKEMLNDEYDDRKKNHEELERTVEDKNQLQALYEEKARVIDDELPQHVNKLAEDLKAAQDIITTLKNEQVVHIML